MNYLKSLLLAVVSCLVLFACHENKETRTSVKKKEFDQHFYQAQKEKAAGLKQEAILSFEKALNYGNDPVVHYEIAKLILEQSLNDFSSFRSLQEVSDTRPK